MKSSNIKIVYFSNVKNVKNVAALIIIIKLSVFEPSMKTRGLVLRRWNLVALDNVVMGHLCTGSDFIQKFRGPCLKFRYIL